jgi:hypothetical protein
LNPAAGITSPQRAHRFIATDRKPEDMRDPPQNKRTANHGISPAD